MAGKMKTKVARVVAAERALDEAMKLSNMAMSLVPRRYAEAEKGAPCTQHSDFLRYYKPVSLALSLTDAIREVVDMLRSRAGLPALVEAEQPEAQAAANPDEKRSVDELTAELDTLMQVRHLAGQAAALTVVDKGPDDMGPRPVGGFSVAQRIRGSIIRASWTLLFDTEIQINRLRGFLGLEPLPSLLGHPESDIDLEPALSEA